MPDFEGHVDSPERHFRHHLIAVTSGIIDRPFAFDALALPFLLDGSDANLVKLSAERLNSFGPTAAVFQFENCQWRMLAENLDLEIDEFLDFSLDGGGWGCHHAGLLERVYLRPVGSTLSLLWFSCDLSRKSGRHHCFSWVVDPDR